MRTGQYQRLTRFNRRSQEHFAVLGFTECPFSVQSRWYMGQADITSFELDELLATKMRALYQRRKGRDLFDLAMGLRDTWNMRSMMYRAEEFGFRECGTNPCVGICKNARRKVARFLDTDKLARPFNSGSWAGMPKRPMGRSQVQPKREWPAGLP